MLTRRMVLLCPSVALAGGWRNGSFPNWDDDTVLRLLVDSPWAHQRRVRFTWFQRNEQPITYKDIPGANKSAPASSTIAGGSPVGGIGGAKPKIPDTADLIFRWVSALPVRQAKALYRQRSEKLPPGKAPAMVESRSGGYVFEIFGLPVIAAHRGAGAVEDKLRQSAVMRTRSGRTIRPSKVVTSVDGDTMSARLHFAPDEPIVPADRELELSGSADIFEFRERFRLSTMMYLDRLEL